MIYTDVIFPFCVNLGPASVLVWVLPARHRHHRQDSSFLSSYTWNTLGRGVCLRRCHDYVKDTLLKVFKTKPNDRDKLQPAVETNIALVQMKNSTVLRMEMAQRVLFMIPFWSFENLKSPSTLVPVHDAQSQRVSNKSSKYKVGAGRLVDGCAACRST